MRRQNVIAKRDFFNRNTVRVAQDLLGCFLVRRFRGRSIKGLIVETEAYRGEYDLACHAAKGKTRRTAVMYGPAGYAYIYLIYGMHWMLNVVTEKKDFPAAVLIRGVVVADDDNQKKGGSNPHSIKNQAVSRKELLSGPGRVTNYFKINKGLNGADLTRKQRLWIEIPQPRFVKAKIKKSPRVGIDYAKHCRNWKWNFQLDNWTDYLT